MTTSLTCFGITTNSTTLTTAKKLISASGGAKGTIITSKIGTATGWGEVTSQGTTNAWSAAGSQPAPTGLGWLFDVTTLEGQTFVTGTWTWNFNLQLSGSSDFVSANIVVRFYKRSSGGTYTSIGSATQSSQSISGFQSTAYTANATSVTGLAFSTGDKLYTDLFVDATFDSTTSTTTVGYFPSNSTSAGWTGCDIVTPGYSSTTGGVPALSQQIIYSIPSMAGGSFV